MITHNWCGKPLFVGAWPGLVSAGLDSPDGPLRAWGVTRLVNATSDQPSTSRIQTLNWEVVIVAAGLLRRSAILAYGLVLQHSLAPQ